MRIWVTFFLILISLATVFSQESIVNIANVYTADCSLVYVEVCVEDTFGFVHELAREDFDLWENTEPVNSSAWELTRDCPPGVTKVDIVLLLDISGSMDDDVDSLRAKIPRFVRGIAAADYRIAIVMFDGCEVEVSGVREIVRTDFEGSCTWDPEGPDNWADDSTTFSCLFQASTFFTSGSGYEDPYGAMVYAAQTLEFRPSARTIFVLFTDERPQVRTGCEPFLDYSEAGLQGIIDSMINYEISVMPVTPHDGNFAGSGDVVYYEGYYELGPATGGNWFHLYDPFNDLIDSVTSAIVADTCCYLLAFKSEYICAGSSQVVVEVEPFGMDSATYFSICPPEPTILMPQPCFGITSCPHQVVKVYFETVNTALIPNSLIFKIAGENYDIFSNYNQMHWILPDTMLFDPLIPWAHYDTVHFSFSRAIEEGDCDLELEECYFIVDLEPPIPYQPDPPDGGVINYPDPVPSISIVDSPAGISPQVFTNCSHVTVTTNGAPMSGFSLNWDGLTLEIHGLYFGVNSLVEICLVGLPDAPDYDYCTPNDTTYCWEFMVTSEGPYGEVIFPEPNTYSACDDQEIIFRLTTDNSLNADSIVVKVNGQDFDMASGYLLLSGPDTLLSFTPPAGFWSDGQIVEAELIKANDIYGNALENRPSISFMIDLSAPLSTFEQPGEIIITDPAPLIVLSLEDCLSGVNPDSIFLEIDGIPYSNIDFDYDDQEGVLTFNPNHLGLYFGLGDTITILLKACDSPDYCAANCADSVWYFFVAPRVECYAYPNPFTPNGDQFNDLVGFDYPEMFIRPAILTVYTLRNERVWRSRIPRLESFKDFEERSWNGKDDRGKAMPGGIYLYTIEVDNKVVCNGSVILAR